MAKSLKYTKLESRLETRLDTYLTQYIRLIATVTLLINKEISNKALY
jgi:hypothetical protein